MEKIEEKARKYADNKIGSHAIAKGWVDGYTTRNIEIIAMLVDLKINLDLSIVDYAEPMDVTDAILSAKIDLLTTLLQTIKG